MKESDICDSINTADIHEIVVTRVNETLTAYKNAQAEFDSPVIKQLVPELATAVTVAVSEAMKGVMRAIYIWHQTVMELPPGLRPPKTGALRLSRH